MGINGIGAAGFSAAGYMARKAERDTGSAQTGFMEAVAKKASQDKKADYDERAFGSVGANAPEEVKQAWMEAAKEAGVNGLGISGNGMLAHLSQMMVQRAENWMNGIGATDDILGSTVQSAIKAATQAIYGLDHPLSTDSLKSIEVQRQQMKERAFYQSFLDKLGALARQ